MDILVDTRAAGTPWSGRGTTAGFAGVEAVAFDLDCTLVDILRVKRRACEAAAWTLADAGLGLDPDAAAADMLDLAMAHGIDRDDVVDLFLLDRYGAVDPLLATLGRQAFEAAEAAESRPYPRVHHTLVELSRRGYRLALITDAPRHRALGRLRAARLEAFFETIVTVEDTPRGKLDARPYEIALARLGLAARALVMVGDNPRRDVRPPKAMGCRTILAAYGTQPSFASDRDEDAPEGELRRIDDLLGLLPAQGLQTALGSGALAGHVSAPEETP